MAEQIGERHLFNDDHAARAQQEGHACGRRHEQRDGYKKDGATGILATRHKLLRFEASAAA
jgi:hypothetical protein